MVVSCFGPVLRPRATWKPAAEQGDSRGSGHGVGEQLGGGALASLEKAAEGLERPRPSGRLARKHVIENDLGRSGSCDHGFHEIARDELPAQARVGTRLPVAVFQYPVRAAVPQIGKLFVVGKGEAKGVEIVFEADDVQGTQAHRSVRGEKMIHLRLVAADGGHGIGCGAESNIPENERMSRRAVFGRPETGGEVRLLDIELLGLLHRRRAGVHDLAAFAVENAGKSFAGGVDFIVAEHQPLDGFRTGIVDGIVQVVLVQEGALFLVKLEEAAGQDAFADFAHELVIEVNVMLAEQLPAEGFLCLGEMVEIGAGIARASRARAGGVELVLGELVNAAPQLQESARGEGASALGDLRGNDAVEHVHAAMHGFQDVERRADAHEVARLVAGQEFRAQGAHVLALALSLSDREPADRKAVECHPGEALRARAAKFRIKRALDDGEHGLRRIAAGGEASRRPALREFHGGARRGFVGGGGDALIERHHDVAVDRHLRFDAYFGAEQQRAAIDVALKNRTLLGHGAGVRQGEYLEAARIGEDGAFPAHEAVNAAGAAKDLGTGPQQEMIGIREENLRAGVLEGLRKLGLDCRLGADGHEERREHLVVQGAEASGPGPGSGGLGLDLEIQSGSRHGTRKSISSKVSRSCMAASSSS